MQKYQNNVTGRNGDVVTGGSVLITAAGGVTPSTIYSDNGSTVAANPLTTDANGYFEFFVADGTYDIRVNGTLAYTDVLIVDALTGLNGRPTNSELAASDGATKVGTTAGTVQAALDARPTSVDLAADTGTAVLKGTWFGGVIAFISALGTSIGATLIGFIQNGTGAIARSIFSKFAEIVTITDYDQGDGDDAMQARAVAYCKTLSHPARLIIPPGDFTATDTWVFDLPNYSTIEFLGSVTSSVSAKPAIRLGSASTNIFGLSVTGTHVVRTANDPTSGSIGVEIANLVWSSVHIRRAEGFTDGVLLNGTQSNGGVSYLRLLLDLVYNNKYNLRATASGVGYCNEINIHGGRFGYSSGYPDYTGTANAVIDHYAGNRLNNIRFHGPSFEAVNAATRAAIISGRYCLFASPRMENPADITGFAIEFTANSEGCVITGKGFGLNTSNIIDAGTNNSYVTKQTSFVRNEAGADTPIMMLQSNASNNAYSIQGKTTAGVGTWFIRQDGRFYSAQNGYFETGIRWSSTSGTYIDRGLFSGSGSPESVTTASVGSIFTGTTSGAAGLWRKATGTGNTGWLPVQVNSSGTTANRPASPTLWQMYGDTTLNKPVWHNGTNWIDATGATV